MKHLYIGMQEQRRVRDFLFRHLHLLGRDEQNILVLRYGVIKVGRVGWGEVAALLGIQPVERVHQHHAAALKKIVRLSREDIPPSLRWDSENEYAQQKRRARRLLIAAINTGRVERKPCEKCGNPKSEGHHPDYSKALEVVWLCHADHAVEHARLRNKLKQSQLKAA